MTSTPYTEDQGGAVSARCSSGASSTRWPPRSTIRRCGRHSSARMLRLRGRAGLTRRSVHERSARRPRCRHDWGNGDRDRSRRIRARPDATRLPASTPRPGWAEQDPEDWWHAAEAVLSRLRDEAGPPAGIGLSGQMQGSSRSTPRTACSAPRSCGATSARRPSVARSRTGSYLERLIALTGNRALPGFTAPKLPWCAPTSPRSTPRSRVPCCPRTTSDSGSAASGRPTSPTLPARCSSTSHAGAGAKTCSKRSSSTLRSCQRRSRARRSPGHTAAGVPVAAGGGDQAVGASGVGVAAPGPFSVALGTSGVVFAALEEFVFDERGRVHDASATRCPAPGTRWA